MARLTTIPLLLCALAFAQSDKPGWLGVSVETKDGVLVLGTVAEGSPAAKAGLRPGDALLRANDRELKTFDDLRGVLGTAKSGDKVAFRVRRGDEALDVAVTLGDRPAPPKRGIAGKAAPAWNVDRWGNLKDGVEKLDVTDLRGKTVYLYCFQSWCPGCHSHGFPTLKKVRARYADDPNVVFVVMQTVFEGFGTNTWENGLKTLAKFDLKLPYAMTGQPGKRSAIMRDYKTGGTPWAIIIDPQGNVRFDGFRIEADEAIKLIEDIRKPAPARSEVSFPSADGLTITADHYKGGLPASAPVLVLFHQAGWSRGEYREIAPRLNKLGYICLAIDQRSGGAVNDVPNATLARAKAASKGTAYLDARQDMVAALRWARKQHPESRIVGWGSSYSAALALHIAGTEKGAVDAVLAFAPGEYFKRFGKPDDYVTAAARNITVPAFVTAARREAPNWKGIFEAIPGAAKTGYVPETAGNHGSRALWERFPDNAGYWEAVKRFLAEHVK